MACFNAYAADTDLDWGFWAGQGSYYYRENNPEYMRRMEIITKTLQGI